MKGDMAGRKRGADKEKSNGGNLGFEEKLWQAADKMLGRMDPAEYKWTVPIYSAKHVS